MVEPGADADVPPAPAHRWQPSTERILLALLLIGAALVRFLAPDQLEPNVSVVETTHLASIEAMLLQRGPGLIGLNEAGASGLALSVPAIFRMLGREPEQALRLYAALGSLAMVAAFYLLCRSYYPPLVSLSAAALLAFSPWSDFFGRNGELNAFVALAAILALWLLRRAFESGGVRAWLRCGAVAAAAIYWHPVAIWLLPALLLAGATRLSEPGARRHSLTIGLALVLVAGLVVGFPAAPSLATHGGPLAPVLIDQTGAGPAGAPPASVVTRLQQTARAFFLLDPTIPGNARYLPVGRAPLDGLTGVLLLVGLGLAAWRPPAHLAAIAMFFVPLFGSQLTSTAVPDLGRAVVAVPGMYLLVAGALDRILVSVPFRSVASAIVLVALPVYAFVSWQAFSGWMGSSQSAQARQPAIDYDEIDAWLAEQHERIATDQPIVTADEWRQANPRLTTGTRAVRRQRDAAGAPQALAPASLRLDQTQAIQGDRDANAARGVAVTAAGDVFVANQAGRVSRLDQDKNTLVPLSAPSPGLQQISEIVAGLDGQVYLVDAERSLLVKVDARGAITGTLGAEWGMYRPRGATVGPDGTIYVADTGRNRIVVASPDGHQIKSIGPRTSAGDLEQPTDVAVDASGRIYVALPDQGRLTVLDDEGQVLGGWPIAKADTIDAPHIAVVTDGAIAITDPSQRRVWIADADGREIDSIPTNGRPYGAAAGSGRLFVTEPSTGRVLVFALQPR
jgi:DNA-binding beta-propeller fold protein YncE